MRKAQYLRASMGALLLCSFFVAAPLQAGDEIKLSAAQAKAMGVATAPLASSVTAGGKGLPARAVIPNHQLYIVSAPLAGLVENISVTPNQAVKKGQVLARLQSPGLVEIQRGFLQAATQAQLARDSLSRDEKLFQDGIIAEGRYLASKGRQVEAVAALSERRQALALAGMSSAALQRLEKSHALSGSIAITAPVSGIALELMAVPGQRVDAAMPLVKLAQIVPLWLDIQVPLAQIAGLKAGGVVNVPAYHASGKITQIGRGVEEGNQTVTVRAEIRQGAENLRPGQFVEAVLTMDSDDKHWHVPSSALVRQRDQAYVFVQTATGFFAKSVKLGGETAGNTVVIAEFKGDEHIAVSGTVSLKAMWQGLAAGGE